MFHYRLMTVMRRAMIYKATCHTLSPGDTINAYQLDLLLFKDMGIGGILSKFIGNPDIGGYEGYSLLEPVATWYRSFYTDYMTLGHCRP